MLIRTPIITEFYIGKLLFNNNRFILHVHQINYPRADSYAEQFITRVNLRRHVHQIDYHPSKPTPEQFIT